MLNKMGFMLLTGAVLVDGQQLFYNQEKIPTPLFRYRLWDTLTADETSDATSLTYVTKTWEEPPFALLERTSFLDLTPGQIGTAMGMGFTEDMWDLFINHFDDYDWSELQMFLIDAPFIALGWSKEKWSGQSPPPDSEDADWMDLTDAEKQAAADIGFFQETWDDLKFADFVETSLFLTTPFATSAPVTAAPVIASVTVAPVTVAPITVAPATEAPAPPSFGGFCFPGSSRVDVQGKGLTSMDRLVLGDHVLVATMDNNRDVYEPIYSFGHYNRKTQASFVQLTTRNKSGKSSTLELSADHMVVSNNKGTIPASLVEISDELLDAAGNPIVVQKISSVEREGVYAPFTPSGKLVVDGVLVSSYVAFQDSAFLTIDGVETPISFHWLAHAFSFPHRFYCKHLSCTSETYTADGVATWVAIPFGLTRWIFQQNAIVVSLCMAIVVTLFSVLTILEAAPMTIMLAAIAAAAARYFCVRNGLVVLKKGKQL
mmetsp:Transcript_32292/g.53390  ORF Transcript_32292/g.53390 Transcript_32292/m.53390 type:complete len:487 (-) Transcript_32292:53-1513(-)